jgi:hypothetical protein
LNAPTVSNMSASCCASSFTCRMIAIKRKGTQDRQLIVTDTCSISLPVFSQPQFFPLPSAFPWKSRECNQINIGSENKVLKQTKFNIYTCHQEISININFTQNLNSYDVQAESKALAYRLNL